MIDHVWSILCSRAIIDLRTNNISLIDIVEEIMVPVPPTYITERKPLPLALAITVVSLWRRELDDQPTKGRGRVRLLMPHQNEAKQISVYEIDLSEKLRTRAYGDIPGIPFMGPGTYRFIIQLQNEREDEWKEVASIPLRVTMQAAKEPTPLDTGKDIVP